VRNRVTGDASAARRHLGRTLRKARTTAGLTQEAVARQLGCLQGKVNKIETTDVTIDLDDLKTMLVLYEVPEDKAEELTTLARRIGDLQPRRAEPVPMTPAFIELSDLESGAAEIRCWHSERIPRPLQSQHYLLYQFQTAISSDDDVTELLRHWKARTRIFDLAEPPRYRAILSESSLRRMPHGRRELIVDQAEHLCDLMCRYVHVSVQVLTFDADLPSVDTDFQALYFADEETDFVYVEYSSGAKKITKAKDRSAFERQWQALHAAALNRADTLTFLEDLARATRNQRVDN
jgi:transcriptional regulator with XRE-family HTH domain